MIESKPDNVLEDLRYAQRPKASVYTALNDLMRAGRIVCCMTAPTHRSPILQGWECLYPIMFSFINVFTKYRYSWRCWPAGCTTHGRSYRSWQTPSISTLLTMSHTVTSPVVSHMHCHGVLRVQIILL